MPDAEVVAESSELWTWCILNIEAYNVLSNYTGPKEEFG